MIRSVRERESALRAKFKRAAELFRRDGRVKQSAQCLYSAECYEEALALYEQCALWKQAGEAAYLCDKFELAGDYFERALDHIRAIDSWQRTRNWDRVLQCVHHFKESMSLETRDAYLRQFLPIALEELGRAIELEHEEAEQK